MQALPPQVWTSLQDSAGEVLQAMASAVDRAMDHPGLSSSVDTSSMASSGPGSTNVTCIAMPVPLSTPLPAESQVSHAKLSGAIWPTCVISASARDLVSSCSMLLWIWHMLIVHVFKWLNCKAASPDEL